VTRLTWGVVGQRFYEVGVDRGVLFVDDVGYPWNGLVSVEEAPSGGDAKAYYLDGVKYLQLSAREEFEATISAFYSPLAFDECDGLGAIQPGLLVAQQRRKSFGFSYRTNVANDVDGTDYGYKLHIVYDALATPTQRNNASMKEDVDPQLLSWELTTKTRTIPGMMHSSHFVIDTTLADAGAVADIEDILYGTVGDPPTLPTPTEVIAVFTP
jgi:hypothetical protein